MMLIYVVMQKRVGDKVYADLHKTDGKFYFTAEEAEDGLWNKGELAKHFHVVPIVATTVPDWCQLNGLNEREFLS